MKITDLTPGEIYLIPGTRPTYALVLDNRVTYKSPNKAKAPGFTPTGTKKSHSNAQGVLVIASKDRDQVVFASENLDIEWCVEVATKWPGTLDRLILRCCEDLPRGHRAHPLNIATTVISSHKFIE